MKTNLLVLLALLMTFSMSGAQSLLNSGPLTVKLMASFQSLDNSSTSKTNSNSGGSTVTTVSKSTVTNEVIDTGDLLGLLENSFNTTFPAGSQLVANRTGDFLRVFVADATGTNVVLDLTSNLFIATVAGEEVIHSGVQTVITKSGPISSVSANDTETFTETVVFGYDDTGLTTADGTHTHFQVTCLLVRKTSENQVNQKIKDTIKFQGVGNGIIRDKNVILQGSGRVVIHGVLFVF
jgi:hypothetical protein